jgi:hypothetical protein
VNAWSRHLSTPNSIHGAYAYLATNAAPGERRVYVKVTVNGLPTEATGVTATLQLWGQTTSTAVFTVRQVPSTWTEGGLTWNNEPALGATVAFRTGATAGQYNNLDVSSYVTGNGSYAMAVTASTTTQVNFTSKESTANHPPRLTLAWSPPPPADPVVAAAGDIACAPPATRTSSTCHQQDTANLLAAGATTPSCPSATCSMTAPS